ncbi:hypothetical protein LSH36_628g03007 [Paralvinella palmiformis]|uniref:BK channel n=1 Tax=Paralvinella palmiformis TaxID=53620 RepID=A0AAD9J4C8_9ANNE|nr:hypothetical protein LSH36_628g03007 [Paralvinella palmiformis]
MTTTTTMSASTTTSTTDQQTTTIYPCLEERYWSYFLASSLITFFAGLIVILLLRLLRYLGCSQRQRRYDAQMAASLSKSAREIHAGRDPAQIRISCLTKLKWICENLMSGQNVSGRILVSMSCLLSIASLTIYLIDATVAENASETCIPWIENITQQVDFGFNIFFMLIFFIRLIAANDRLLFWLEIASFVDYFTIPPSFVGLAIDRQWLGLRFLRALRLMSFPDILQYLSVLRTSNSIRLAQLMFIFIGVTLTGAGFIHLVETTGDPFNDFNNGQDLTYWEAVYFCIVTMSTVGYGDIYCITTIGRIFMVVFILGALAMFASFIPEMMEIFGRRQRYIGTYEKPSGVRHIVLCGHITYESVQHFLRDFLHEDRDNSNVKCIFLDNKHPDLELEALFKRHFTHVVFFKGSVMNTRDLQRVKLFEADACLVLANPRSRDPDAQDAANVMRVIAVKNYYEDIRVIVQLMRYSNKAFCLNLPSWRPLDQVICLAEMKLGFMAQGCLAPGFSTLMANLFVMRSYKKSAKCDHWQDMYLEGAGMEVYTVYFSPAFYGKTFPQAAQICYTKLNILLLAVAIPHNQQTTVLLNPGSDVIIEKYVKGFFVCQSEDEAKRALYFCLKCHLHLSNRSLIRACKCDDPGYLDPKIRTDIALEDDVDGGFLTIQKSQIKFRNSNGAGTETDLSLPPIRRATPCDVIEGDNPDSGHSSSSEIVDDLRPRTGDPEWLPDIGVRIWLPFGSRPSVTIQTEHGPPLVRIERFDTTGLFHWCPTRKIDDCILEDNKTDDITNSLRDHVILCLFTEKTDPLIGLCNFIMPLRASTLKIEELQPIVLLGDELYLRREWSLLCNFPDIYLKPGSPLNRSHLRHASISTCHMCVILTTNDTNVEDATLIDKEAILCSLNIKTMSSQDKKAISTMIPTSPVGDHQLGHKRDGRYTPLLTELASDHNAQFLDQDDEDDPSTPLYMTQPFACGRAFAASVLDTLMSTTYYNSELLTLIRMLITGGANAELEQQLAEGLGFVEGCQSSEDLYKLRARCRVNLLPLNGELLVSFVNGPYGNMVIGALRQCGILCIGLYRYIDIKQTTAIKHRFVITNPPSDTFLYPTDQVYCLQPYYLKGELEERASRTASTQAMDTQL